jgi:hypothetical protein
MHKQHANAVSKVTMGRYLLPPSEPVSPYVFVTSLTNSFLNNPKERALSNNKFWLE